MKLKTLIISLFLLLTISTAETVTTNRATVPIQKGVSNPQVIYKIPNSNTPVQKLSESGLFYNINYNGVNGWIAKQYTVEGEKTLISNISPTSVPKVYANSVVKTDAANALPAVNEAQLKFMINNYCKGVRKDNLSKLTSHFIKMQETYKVNAVFAVAASIIESGGGTGGKLINTLHSYNMFSIKGTNNGKYVTFNGSKWKKYSNFGESIMDFGNLIANGKYYFQKGKYTPATIAPTYCNTAWGNSVYRTMDALYATLSKYPTTSTSSSSSTTSSSTINASQTPKIIYVGDSRVVAMKSHVPTKSNDVVYIAKSAMGLDWLKSTGYPELKKQVKKYPNAVVVFCLGINDRPNADKYISFYRNTVLKELAGKEIYFMTVNPVNEKLAAANNKYKVYNKTTVEFNNKLKAAFPNLIVDTYSVLINHMGTGTTSDGVHYKESVSKLIHSTTISEIKRLRARNGLI